MAYDRDAAIELSLFIDNDSFMYNRSKEYIANVKSKLKSKKYDPSKAWKLWLYYVEEGAQRYMKEIAGGGSVSSVFNKDTRNTLAKEYAETAYRKIQSGEL